MSYVTRQNFQENLISFSEENNLSQSITDILNNLPTDRCITCDVPEKTLIKKSASTLTANPIFIPRGMKIMYDKGYQVNVTGQLIAYHCKNCSKKTNDLEYQR